ncbi:hemin-degrading factor [Chryseobacterium sp. 2TAF14]|uniref:hemin-degrading factor n=1 Tax=Chryseobacterium sp. 2TAF14 TaxID=3233007 RepID=UPI003F9306B0
MNTIVNDLKEKWEALKAENPHLRIRNAAEKLGVSEAELLLTNVGEEVTVLKPEFANILTEVEKLGKVMALTRNDECVHERKGTYLNGDFSSPHAQLFVGEDIDLRIFMNHWKFAFAVVEGEALRLAPEGYAKKIDPSKVVNVLEDASEKRLPIMVFVGNRGIIQIHTGEVKKTMWHQQWFNVMDPDFNLHLDVTKIAEAWIVKKPTEDGEVTAIEVFNNEGEFIVQFFGKRKPGIPELQEWKDLVASLEQ